MPGLLNGRKRSSVALNDEDELSDASHGSATSKRARHARDASDGPAPTGAQQRLNSDHYTGGDGEDAHQPGSLVRVKLTNFVTYTAAEFHLGPSLNMIIGPNGTGKSTLVCAICLGLGWSPQHLGRAKDIGEYVKHGSAEAVIEIELAASEKQKSNPVICRMIKKAGSKSVFFIDGHLESQKTVIKLARSFSIQIDNLCQFLPQDRVVEFARMDPVSLLRETQRAAAPDRMLHWHDALKDLRRQEKKLEVEHRNQQHHLTSLQAKQNATREDVERYNQRQELVTKSNALEKCRPIISKRILEAELHQLKEELRANNAELQRYRDEVEPARRAQSEMEAYRDQIEQVSKSRKQRFDIKKSNVDKLASKIDTDQQSLNSFTASIDAEKHAERQRKQDMNRIENEITRLNGQLENNRMVYDQTAFESKKSEIRTRKSAAAQRHAEILHEIKSIRLDSIRESQLLQQKKNEKAQLQTQNGQQANLLAKLSKDSYDAWRWLEQNMSSLGLKDQVYGPPILVCSVPNPTFADAVESQIRAGDLTAITCTNADDAQLIQNKLLGAKSNGGLGLHHITIRTVSHPRSWYRSPMTPEELERLGFEGFLSDFIQGPDPVLAMLCELTKIHQTAYTPKRISNELFSTLQNRDQLSRWVGETEVYRIVRRREYGALSVTVNPLKQAQYFTDQPINTADMQRLDADIMNLERDLTVRKEQHVAQNAELDKAKEQLNKANTDLEEVQAGQDRAKKAHAEWQGLPRKIDSKKKEWETLKNLSQETHERIAEIQDRYEDDSLKVAALILEYAKAVTQLRTLHESSIEAEIRLVEAKSEVLGFKNDNQDILKALAHMESSIKTLGHTFETKKAEYKKLKKQAERLDSGLTESEKEIMEEFKALDSFDELDRAIADVENRLAVMAEGDPHAIKAYEKREQEIINCQRKLEEDEETLEQTQTEIKKIREEWEPELDRLVARISEEFSHNFQKIGCAGQVSVYKDEDFEKWAIQIQVRFRENEALSVLNSTRQSGGERAVSTGFYLIALQDLARSPFRVVDEINQGMDPRNERMVYERIVDIACRERSSQYFLVTPKLLNGLNYDPKMRVHCIASGEHMPDQHTDLNFQSLAKRALTVRQRITAAV